jgi:hypothetical protein
MQLTKHLNAKQVHTMCKQLQICIQLTFFLGPPKSRIGHEGVATRGRERRAYKCYVTKSNAHTPVENASKATTCRNVTCPPATARACFDSCRHRQYSHMHRVQQAYMDNHAQTPTHPPAQQSPTRPPRACRAQCTIGGWDAKAHGPVAPRVLVVLVCVLRAGAAPGRADRQARANTKGRSGRTEELGRQLDTKSKHKRAAAPPSIAVTRHRSTTSV